MTKFLFYSLLLTGSTLLIGGFCIITISKMSKLDNQTLNRSLHEEAPFLKIKKTGVHKQIVSPNDRYFFCSIKQSDLKLQLLYPYTCEEFLNNLSGELVSPNLEKNFFFKGESGILNYQNFAITINKCRFQIHSDTLTDYQDDTVETACGGMKTLTLSLLRK